VHCNGIVVHIALVSPARQELADVFEGGGGGEVGVEARGFHDRDEDDVDLTE